MPAGPGSRGRVGGACPSRHHPPCEPRTGRSGALFSLRRHQMVIVVAAGAGDADLAEVVQHVQNAGGSAFVSRGVTRTIVGVVGTEEVLETLDVALLPGVDEVVRITAPYKLVSSENTPKRSTVSVGGVPIGPETFTLIAGPCA